MPRYNGTGPRGQGSLSGRGRGYCAQRSPGYDSISYGRRMGCGMGRGFGRGLGLAPILSEREILEDHMRSLEEELRAVKDALGNTKED
jgi:hypothetical protein